MEKNENFKFKPEQTPEEFMESLRHTEAGKYMEGEPKPDKKTLEEQAPVTNRQIEKEMSGEKHRVCWEGPRDRSGCSEYMPKEKAQRWMGMLQEEYLEPPYHHWLESEKEESKKN